jgi:hypothetical protein
LIDGENFFSVDTFDFQPYAFEVEAALREAYSKKTNIKRKWQQRLSRLNHARKQLEPVQGLITRLKHYHWTQRFIARHCLVAWGGQAVANLYPLAINHTTPLQPIYIWLINNIGLETTKQLAKRANNLLCPNCLIRCAPHRLNIPYQPEITFYGCRACTQSWDFLSISHLAWTPRGETQFRHAIGCPNSVWTPATHAMWEILDFLEEIHHIIGILDVAKPEEQVRHENSLWINWLHRRTLFDFDRVEILHSSDEEVERFAVQVGNDTDPFRKPGYQQISCVIEPGSQLSENTLRILRRTFGEVEPLSELKNTFQNDPI